MHSAEGGKKYNSRRSPFIPIFDIDINHRRRLLHLGFHLMYSPGFDHHSHIRHCLITDKVDILPSICYLRHRFQQQRSCIVTIYETTANSGGKAGLLLVQILCLSVLFLTYLATTVFITGECFGWQNNDREDSCFILLPVENPSIHAAPSGIFAHNLFNRSLLIVISY